MRDLAKLTHRDREEGVGMDETAAEVVNIHSTRQ